MGSKTSTARQGDFTASLSELKQHKNKQGICNLKHSCRESEKKKKSFNFPLPHWVTSHTTQCNIIWQKSTLSNPKKEINLTFALRTGPRVVSLGHSCRITEWLRLGGISGGHLVHHHCSSRIALQQAVQDHIQKAFGYLQGKEMPKASLGDLCQCSVI